MSESVFLPSTCPHDCPSTCALELEKRPDGTLGKVRGSKRIPYTAGVICAKVSRYAERRHHPDRLGHPLKRTGPRGSGQYERIGWEQALDEVAEALLQAEQSQGSESVWPYWYAGTMGLINRDGINRLTHAKKYSRFKSTICTALADAGVKAGHGARRGVSAVEASDYADLIVVWGANPVSTNVNLMTHMARARSRRNAKLVVIDPYRSPTAIQADMHLALRPGTDGALACGVMHVLFAEGFADRSYLRRHTDCPDELEQHLQNRTPEWAAAITGLTANQIREFARLFGSHKHAWIRLGFGFTRSRNGAANMHAASCLPIVTGAWQHKGGGSLYYADYYGWDKTVTMGLDVEDPSTRILDQSRIGPILTGDRDALRGGPPVNALFIQSTNPMSIAPDLSKVHQGFARDDLFICVHEQFMTETAEQADIVLPATMFMEHDDIYQASGHTHIQVTKAQFEPFEECRSNHQVICDLAKRLGAQHPGFDMAAWEMMNDLLTRSNWPDAQTIYDAGSWDTLPGFEAAHCLKGFPNPDGKFHFKPNWASIGPDYAQMPVLPDHLAITEEISPETPYRLVAAPARQFLNSTFTETASSLKREQKPRAFVNPEVLRQLSLNEGDLVRLGNHRGEVTIEVTPREGQHPDTIVVESIWPNKYWPGGIGINALISADPAPPAGGAAIHDTAVWMEAVNETRSTTRSNRISQPAAGN